MVYSSCINIRSLQNLRWRQLIGSPGESYKIAVKNEMGSEVPISSAVHTGRKEKRFTE